MLSPAPPGRDVAIGITGQLSAFNTTEDTTTQKSAIGADGSTILAAACANWLYKGIPLAAGDPGGTDHHRALRRHSGPCRPDAGGLSNWTTLLDVGMSQSAIVAAMWNSTEHRTQEVTGYYQHFLGRAPDLAGLAVWVANMQHGVTEEQVMASFLASPEYLKLHLPSAGFVTALYQNVLGRDADTLVRSIGCSS